MGLSIEPHTLLVRYCQKQKLNLATTYSPEAKAPVPSAQESLTAVFEMGTGVSSPLSSPGYIISFVFLLLTSLTHSFSLKTAQHLLKSSIKSLPLGQALGLLVPVSLIHCCTYTSGLSTCLSFRGLTVQEATNMIQEAGLLACFFLFPTCSLLLLLLHYS